MEEINFEWVRPLESHARLIMDWRNDPLTLQMSYHPKAKVWESFFKEFSQDYFNSSMPPLFALFEGQRIAFLRFVDCLDPKGGKRRVCELSINIAPQFRYKGLGIKILQAVHDLLKGTYDDILAELKVQNLSSKRLFEKAGYELLSSGRKRVDGLDFEIYSYLYSLEPKMDNSIFIIAEAGSNWRMGHIQRDLAMAKALIDVAVEAKADAVKFQVYRAESVYVSNAGKSAYLAKAGIEKDISEIFRDLAMPYEMIEDLYQYSLAKGIEWMATPFGLKDFEAIDPFVKRHKIASYEISHSKLIEQAAKSGKPLIMSTGASTINDITWAVEHFKNHGGEDLSLLQCSAKYPATIENMNLSVIPFLKKKFKCRAGLSDHSLHPFNAPLTAVGLGASVIEKHFTIDRRLPGPDHSFALQPLELKEMVSNLRAAEKMVGSGFKVVESSEVELYNYARRGIQALCDIESGEKLELGRNIDILRPGQQKRGVHPKLIGEIEGKPAKKKILLGQGIEPGDY